MNQELRQSANILAVLIVLSVFALTPVSFAADASVTLRLMDDGFTYMNILSPNGEVLRTYTANLSKRHSPATRQTASLQKWESYKLGAFFHYNTSQFTGVEVDRSRDPKVYNPTNLNVTGWIDTIRQANMKYAVLTARHAAGFLLWDSPTTSFDVASSGNKTDVVKEFTDECRKQDVASGLYYCMWGGKNPEARAIILAQLYELASNYGEIPYFWIDMMNWAPKDLPAQEVYDLLKNLQPNAIVLMNQHIQDGTTIKYFPTDVLNGEITTPPEAGHQPFREIRDVTYYLPFEAELVSQAWGGKSVSKTHLGSTSWFTYGKGKGFPESTPFPPKDLHEWVTQAYERGASNVLLSLAPDYTGSMREEDVNQLKQLGKLLEGDLKKLRTNR